MRHLVTGPLLEDLKALHLACEQDDYENMNIFANRVMSNAIVEDNGKFLVIGFLLKDAAIEMMELTARKQASALATAKALVMKFVEKMDQLARSEDFKEDEIWSEYVDLSERIRKFHLLPIEEKSYSDHHEFTRKVTEWILEHVEKNREILLESRNQLLTGALNELGRVYRIHGADKREIIILSLFTALDRVYDYARFASVRGADLDAERVQEATFPYLDRIIAIARTEPRIEDVDALLCELVTKWREAFIRYMELRPRPGIAVEKGIQLPEETKKRITEAVTKALEAKEKAKK